MKHRKKISTLKAHTFEDGGMQDILTALSAAGYPQLALLGNSGGTTASLSPNISAGISAAAPIITQGNHMVLGDLGMAAGNLISPFDPVTGAIVTGASVLANAAFGSNVNEPVVKDYENKLVNYSRLNLNAKNNRDLLNQLSGLGSISIKRSDLGTQGWFNHDIDKTYKRLQSGLAAAEASRGAAVDNAVRNVNKRNAALVAANYNAFGGPLYGYFGEGPSAYAVAMDNLRIKQLANEGKASENVFADGGGIHIKPSKRGTFTAAAKKHGKSVQAFASQVLANPDNYSPAMRKKANFARNASKWHANGGMLFSDNFTNGVNIIGVGGTHEMNPHGGVPVGLAPDGQPNLVEEGEAIFNDYVFSNRLRVPKEVRNKYKLRGPKDMTFADAFKFAQKESEERENDPISKNGLDNIAMILARTQEAVKSKENSHVAANGGHVFKTGDYIIYDKGLGTKDYFKALYDPSSSYMQALSFLNDPANITARDALIADINSGKYDTAKEKINGYGVTGDNWYNLATDYKKGPVHNAVLAWAEQQAELANAARAANNTPLPQVSIAGLPNTIPTNNGTLLQRPTVVNTEPGVSSKKASGKTGSSSSTFELDPSILRYAEPIGNLGMVMSDLFGATNTPTVFNEIPDFRPISFNPLGDYMPETHFDTRYAANQAAQQAAATRGAIMQSISPSRNAALLAADYNSQIAHGNLLREAALQDYNNLLAAKQFNRATNQYNSETGLKTAMANQDSRLRYAHAALQQAKMNDDSSTMASAARAQNLSNFLESVANIGREADARDWTQMLIDAGVFGTVPTRAACGGKLRKKKKGLTY